MQGRLQLTVLGLRQCDVLRWGPPPRTLSLVAVSFVCTAFKLSCPLESLDLPHPLTYNTEPKSKIRVQ